MGIRKIDYVRCTGCATCVDECPLDVIRLDRFVPKAEIAPCQAACPAGMNMRDYIYLVTRRRMEEAAALVRDTLVLPGVTCRVCSHPCETACARRKVDEAVSIRSLERFVTDNAPPQNPGTALKTHDEKVAIIGSGPCGLAAAAILARNGYPVTIFEPLPVFGGMLRDIPASILPAEVLNDEIDRVASLGVEMFASHRVEATDSLFSPGYKAVLVTEGASRSRKSNSPDAVTPAANHPGIFAVDEIISGPASVIKAIAAGKKSAGSIECFLKGVAAAPSIEKLLVRKLPLKGVDKKPRQVELVLSPEMAAKESERCMACGSKAFVKYLRDCMTCYQCEIDCPEEAIYVSPERESRKPLPW